MKSIKSLLWKVSCFLLFISLFSCKSKEEKEIEVVKVKQDSTIENTRKELVKYKFRYGPDEQSRIHFLSFTEKMASYKLKQIDLHPGLDGGYDKISNYKMPYTISVEKAGNVYVEFTREDNTKLIFEYIKDANGEIRLEGTFTFVAIQAEEDSKPGSIPPAKDTVTKDDSKL